MKPIVLIGGGGHCKSVIDVIEKQEQYKIVGIVDKKEKANERILGYEIFANDDDLQHLADEYPCFLMTMGQIGINRRRTELFGELKEMDVSFPVIISPEATISHHAQIGEGTVILHGAVVNADAKIGMNSIVNTNAVVEHDARIGDHTHISTGAVVNGNCKVGNHCFIGSHSVTLQDKKIADYITLGANATVTDDKIEEGTYVGTPARSTKKKVGNIR